ncbi:tlde1 domain-containing protein [Methylobacterium sp.]|uniref:tlde1 domain-containing protein n=1 Tax=Methylobacterium sp. TaxID=409 RepID=UPI00258A705A|nr:tlde1 domain-containing protein [Methylobacterium sp.]
MTGVDAAPSPSSGAPAPSRRRGLAPLALCLAALMGAGAFGARYAEVRPPAPREAGPPPAEPVVAAVPASREVAADQAPAPATDEAGWRSALLDAVETVPVPAPAAPPDEPETPPVVQSAPLPQAVPLPVPRPPEFRAPRTARPGAADRATRRQAAVAPPPEDTRTFIEKLFDLPAASNTALSYASLEPRPVEPGPVRRILPPASANPSGGVAVYDITARTVTLPNGERLEAHSGLGPKMDDPRHVHVRMHGATPPGIYDLTEREALFHGVRAIRLTPVGGPGAVHGRTGLLAHTYMLGPSGQSNGCVAFRDYNRFLQAFLRGEVRRLVVVAGNGMDGPPPSQIGLLTRPAAANGG